MSLASWLKSIFFIVYVWVLTTHSKMKAYHRVFGKIGGEGKYLHGEKLEVAED